MKITGIYKIQSKIKPKRIYIGSSIEISYRWASHLRALRKNKHFNKKLQNHFNKYNESDLQFSVLLGCDKKELISKEQYFIEAYNPYFNISRAANSPMLGRHSSKETKEKLRKIFTGRIFSKESIAKMSKAQKGRKHKLHTEETKRKIREGNKGKKHKSFTEETKRKMSEAAKRRRHSEETKQKMSNAKKGKHISREHKRNIGESKKNTKWIHKNNKNKRIKKGEDFFYLDNGWKYGVAKNNNN